MEFQGKVCIDITVHANTIELCKMNKGKSWNLSFKHVDTTCPNVKKSN